MCSLCGTRPETRSPVAKGKPWCFECATDIERTKAGKKEAAEWWKGAFKYAIWKGMGIAFVPSETKGMYTPKGLPATAVRRASEDALKRNPDRWPYPALPKDKTVCLDSYVEGYTREQVKRIKRAILKAHFIGD